MFLSHGLAYNLTVGYKKLYDRSKPRGQSPGPQERGGPKEEVGKEGIRSQDAGMGQARRAAPEDGKGEAMIYKRGAVYWYKFRWTVKRQEVASENYRIRKSARTSTLKRAREVEEEHRRALRLGLVDPAEPWPKLKPQVPQIPTLREFTRQFLA